MNEKRKIKVLFLVENFTIGGAQRMVYELVKNIDKTNFDVKVFCYKNRVYNALESAVEQCVEVEYLDLDKYNLIRKYYYISKAIKKYKPDILHAHLVAQLYAVPWAMIHHKPVIITAHTRPDKAFVKKVEFLIKNALRAKKLYIVAVSEANLTLMYSYFKIINANYVCINNGVDIDAYQKKLHETFTYINVARQDENKNQALIIKCFKRIHSLHNNTKLFLIGDGVLHDSLVKYVEELQLTEFVFLPGSIDNVADYYAVSDVYVQSSYREAMPMSVLEAMAAGLPIVSTNVGGLKDVVKGNGILVEVDEMQLYNAMLRMFELPNVDLEIMGKESKQLVKPFSSKVMAEKYCLLYEQVYNEHFNKQ